jgi:hypothetical protein
MPRTQAVHKSSLPSLQSKQNTMWAESLTLIERISSTTLRRQSRYLRPKRVPIEAFCEEEFRRVVEARLAQHHHTQGRLIAGQRYRGPNAGILDRVDAPTLTDQDWERKTPFADTRRYFLNRYPSCVKQPAMRYAPRQELVTRGPFAEETMMNRPTGIPPRRIRTTTPSLRRATWRASAEATRFTGATAR